MSLGWPNTVKAAATAAATEISNKSGLMLLLRSTIGAPSTRSSTNPTNELVKQRINILNIVTTSRLSTVLVRVGP